MADNEALLHLFVGNKRCDNQPVYQVILMTSSLKHTKNIFGLAFLLCVIQGGRLLKKKASYIREAIAQGMTTWVEKFGAANTTGDQKLVEAVWDRYVHIS